MNFTPLQTTKTLSVVGKVIQGGYHHGNCLRGDTIIHLADNSTITIGEWYEKYPDVKLQLWSYDIIKKEFISAIGHTPRVGQVTNEIIEIELENGELINMTDNHPLLTKRGWVKAKDLLETDEIIQKP